MIHFAATLKPRRGRRRKTDAQLAIAYVRVSTEEQANGPEAQRHAIEAYARSQGLQVAAWHQDIGVSGGAPLDERPGLLAALEGLRTDRAAVLLVAKRDRLARDAFAAAMIERLAEHEGARISTADGAGNGDGPEALMLRGMIDLFAQYERALIRMRTRAALGAKKRRGERVGGVPYGKRLTTDGRTLEDHPGEQAIIAHVRKMRAAGSTLQSITDALNADGTPPRGERWHLTTVQRILRQPE